MKVTCSQCLTVYNIPESKLKKAISKTTCRKCGYRIEIRRPTGVLQIQTPKKEIESVESEKSLKNINEIFSNAMPKRILDDERTHLDESRIEQPRPEINTNLAFGPEPSLNSDGFEKPIETTLRTSKPIENNIQEMESFSGKTMPSIGSNSVEHSNIPEKTFPSSIERDREPQFRLDLAMIFCANILSTLGFGLMIYFRSHEVFFHTASIAFLGLSMSVFLSLNSRFGTKDANLIVCALGAIFMTAMFLILGHLNIDIL